MIYVSLKGRLGNQMFIYAYAYAISRENSNEPICITSKLPNRLINYNIQNISNELYKDQSLKQKIFSYLYAKKENKSTRVQLFEFEKKYNKSYRKRGLYYCQNGYLNMPYIHKIKDIYLNGYFQSEKYFEKYKDEIRKIFIPIHSIANENLKKYNEMNENKSSICVDFRMEDYVNNSLHSVCNLGYYRKAMEYISSKIDNPKFYIFSTNLNEVKEMVKDWPFDMVFEDGKNDDYEKLRLMSVCSHFVITNSTYDWWAQYLSNNDNKIVVAPSKWFNEPCPCDIYQDNWVLLDC